jgi:hypothetical protein
VECKAKFLSDGLFDGRIDGKSDEHLMQILMEELMEELMGNLLQIETCPNRTCMFMQGCAGWIGKESGPQPEVLAPERPTQSISKYLVWKPNGAVLYQRSIQAIFKFVITFGLG